MSTGQPWQRLNLGRLRAAFARPLLQALMVPLSLMAAALPAQAQPIGPTAARIEMNLITNIANRQTVALSGAWQSIVDPYETGYYDYRRSAYDQQATPSPSAFYRNHQPRDKQELVEYDFSRSPTLQVPGDWNSQAERLLYYEGTVWLKRSFDHAKTKPDNRVFVHFGAVNQRAEVYFNGEKLGVHEGGFTPFNFEVTHLLKARDNFVVVKADNTRRLEAVPTTSTDWWNYGGITREVTLVEESATFVQDHQLQLKKGSQQLLAGQLKLNGAAAAVPVSINIPELGIERHFRTDAQGQLRYEIDAPGLSLWSPQAPKLYTVWVKTAQQALREDIGFRSIEARGTEILLNGKPIFLRGISVHEENALEGRRAHSLADAEQTLRWARELGCNFVRLAHYPHSETLARLADRTGMLLWAEIPVYWTVDFKNPATLANAEQQLTEMVLRDRNRASVVIWSVANETPVSPARNAFLSRLVERTRALDDTRLVSAALETHPEGDVTVVHDPIGEQLDIISFNQYRGWYGGSLHDAPQARWRVPTGKPVLVSEFGGDALQGLRGSRDERWTEEYQDYLYQQNLAMLEQQISSLRGLSPWILADFRSPRRMLPGIQDGYNRKGLISSQGVRKQAFYTLREFYRRMQARYE